MHRIMTAIRAQCVWQTRVKRGLQSGHCADRHTPGLNMKINSLLRGHCPCRVNNTAGKWKGRDNCAPFVSPVCDFLQHTFSKDFFKNKIANLYTNATSSLCLETNDIQYSVSPTHPTWHSRRRSIVVIFLKFNFRFINDYFNFQTFIAFIYTHYVLKPTTVLQSGWEKETSISQAIRDEIILKDFNSRPQMDPTTTYSSRSLPCPLLHKAPSSPHKLSSQRHTRGGRVTESNWDQWARMPISRSLCETKVPLRRGLLVCLHSTGSNMSEQLCQWCMSCEWCRESFAFQLLEWCSPEMNG